MRINLEGFIYPVAGGERVITHADGTFPGDAQFVSYDPETLTVTYRIGNGMDDEGAPVWEENSLTFTQEQIPNA